MNKWIINHWNCEICSKLRPDKFISVEIFDVSELYNLPFGGATQCIKYCNNISACHKKALDNAGVWIKTMSFDDYMGRTKNGG